MADKKLTYKQKSSIKFVEQEEPAFIKAIKAKTGYREPAKISDKFDVEEEEELDPTKNRDDIRNLAEEERPQIVVLNEATDISGEQLDKEVKKMHEDEDRRKIDEGRIIFRKPEKRPHATDESSGSSKKGSAGKEFAVPEKKSSRPSFARSTNTKMLSFNEDDDSDE